jgi:putative nucleotidyltransferase with HDIG domain
MGKGLLLRLSEEAPGTFNHSLNVANLSAAAAKEIGANIALVRTGALYHDIGKLANPNMFTENQQLNNPLNELSIEDAVQTIKKHVTNGIRLAEKQKLPEDILGFIRTHHGRSQVKYFYIKWCNEHPDQEPDHDFFSYPGPDPMTKEQAIVMIADKIEAASRSLKDLTRKGIRDLVERLTNELLTDGRLNDADITLHELQQCQEVFISQLITINHARIAYPTLHADTAAAKAENK